MRRCPRPGPPGGRNLGSGFGGEYAPQRLALFDGGAASKRAGEDALRALVPEFAGRGVGFTVVSGDMIDGTIIIRLLERRDPDAVAARRTAGPLPTVEHFAATVVRAVDADVPDGHTFYVGGEDYVTAR